MFTVVGCVDPLVCVCSEPIPRSESNHPTRYGRNLIIVIIIISIIIIIIKTISNCYVMMMMMTFNITLNQINAITSFDQHVYNGLQ